MVSELQCQRSVSITVSSVLYLASLYNYPQNLSPLLSPHDLLPSNLQPERHRHGGGGGGGGGSSGGSGSNFKIFVGNLSHCATSADIRNLFEQYGTIAEADVITARGVKTYGFVHMVSRSDGEAAIAALNGYVLHGRVCGFSGWCGFNKGVHGMWLD